MIFANVEVIKPQSRFADEGRERRKVGRNGSVSNLLYRKPGLYELAYPKRDF
jgi:hypothetical protein